jgi:hypothetical protein
MAQEVERLVQRVFQDIRRQGHADLEASEMAVRAASHRIGGNLLEKLLNADGGGYQGASIGCGKGHSARFVEYREKGLVTVLSPVDVRRAYYHCEQCRDGVIPKDRALDIVDTGFSPGVRRMMGQVGGKEAFDEGRKDLEVLAGVRVTTKAVERVSETVGEQIELQNQRERRQIMSGKVVSFVGRARIPKLYVAIDGSGVPVVARETEGRKGKDETGKAKTREAKLGCVFTQTTVDEQGYAVRDEDSTTYVGAIETAECFGPLIYAEAVRRGIDRAEKVSILGDGAKWIWGIAEEHFPGATQIVDLYHAREHLAKVAKLVYGAKSKEFQKWSAARRDELDDGDVEAVIAAMSGLQPRDKGAQEEIQTEIEYFRGNAQRMRYADFRSQGLFVGSGVVEAGCKTIFGQRLKLSGMHWTVRGANAIIALRCCQLSARWEEFWESRASG